MTSKPKTIHSFKQNEADNKAFAIYLAADCMGGFGDYGKFCKRGGARNRGVKPHEKQIYNFMLRKMKIEQNKKADQKTKTHVIKEPNISSESNNKKQEPVIESSDHTDDENKEYITDIKNKIQELSFEDEW